MSNERELLQILAENEGLDVPEMLERDTFDCVCAAICTNVGCGFIARMEPDQDAGYCEECHTNTVKSSLVLAGII